MALKPLAQCLTQKKHLKALAPLPTVTKEIEAESEIPLILLSQD